MEKILLNDLLHINEDSVRIKFNVYNGEEEPLERYKAAPEEINDKWFSGHWQILSCSFRPHISAYSSPDELCSAEALSAETPHLQLLSCLSVRLHR